MDRVGVQPAGAADAEALQTLRKGFARLDDFIANLEPNMWKPAGRHRVEASAGRPQPAAKPAEAPAHAPGSRSTPPRHGPYRSI